MKLSSFLHPHFIKVKHDATSSKEVIHDLVKEICREFSPEFEKKVIDLIMEREKQGPTVEGGVSIPHARIEGFHDLIIAISIPEKPVAVDGEEVEIFFLILTSKTASRIYLNTLAAIARLAKNSELLKKIISAAKPEDVIRIIEEEGVQVKEELTVKDIMEKKFPMVTPGETLKEVIDLLHREDSLFALVVEKGELIGEVRLLEIVEKGLPDYAKSLINLKFLKTFEPLEGLLEREERIQVREVMSPLSVTLTSSSSIVEAVVRMVKEKRFYIPVVEDKKPVGVVTLKEFVTRILRV
ncbi:MAG: PTS transporter subunit EIIA [Caldiserica bacterium]|nr:PTS transporter subunit EIIA [Caldisericota bacterium]